MRNIICLVVLGFLAVARSHAMPAVYFDFNDDASMDSSKTVQVGESFTAALYLSGVDSQHGGMLSWGVEIDFPPLLLDARGFTIENTLWPFLGGHNKVDNMAGKVELLASNLSGGHTGTLKLADIVFNATTAGTATLKAGELFPANANFVGFAGADGHNYDGEISYQSASVSVVPLPAAFWLFLSGIAAFSGMFRFRHQ